MDRSRHRSRWVARIVLVTFCTSLVAERRVIAAPPTTPPPPITLPNPPPQLSPQELRDLVAPVALYPDVILASLLPATTFPEQAHEAAQWMSEDAGRTATPPEDHGWDGSVIALVQFPDVLRWLDTNREWTDEMGQAVTYQQGDVLDAIQAFRRSAADAGNLASNQYQTVQAAPGQDIRIAPAQPDVVYVPSYDPALAVQPQPAVQSAGINPWIAFGGGVAVGALGAWALYSIFDDDDHGHYHQSRKINCYNNYYYYGGRRRPPARQWSPRPVPYRGRPHGGVAHPGRLEHVSTRPAEPMRPPRRRPPQQRPQQQRQAQQRPPQGKRPPSNHGGQPQNRQKQKPPQQHGQGSKKQQGERPQSNQKQAKPQNQKQGKQKSNQQKKQDGKGNGGQQKKKQDGKKPAD